MTTRRAFITGLVSFVAAPAIVRVGSLMPVKAFNPTMTAAEIIQQALERIGDDLYGTSPIFTSGGWLELINWNKATQQMIRVHVPPEEWLAR